MLEYNDTNEYVKNMTSKFVDYAFKNIKKEKNIDSLMEIVMSKSRGHINPEIIKKEIEKRLKNEN